MTKFIIPGEPQPKQRPRVRKNGWTYTPQKTLDYEQLVALCYHGPYYDKDIPLSIEIWCYFKIPASWPKKKQQLAREGKLHVTKRPDVDNLEKIIADGLTGKAMFDDGQIIDSEIHKRYSDNPRVEVTLKEVLLEKEIE